MLYCKILYSAILVQKGFRGLLPFGFSEGSGDTTTSKDAKRTFLIGLVAQVHARSRTHLWMAVARAKSYSSRTNDNNSNNDHS